MSHVTRPTVLAVAGVLAIAAPAAAHGGAPHLAPKASHHGGHGHGQTTRPASIDLPAGFSSEAFTAHGRALYVGSQIDGRILRVDVKTGKQRVVVPGRPGVHANGLRFAGRTIVAAGGTTGKISIYDTRTGAVVRDYDVQGGFVNGVGILGRTAYVTDTIKHVIYAVPADGRGEVRTIAPSGDFIPDALDLDGIIPSGRGQLITGQYGTGKLFTIDAATGAAKLIDLGGATVPKDDGLLLEGRRLYVAQNSGTVTEIVLNRAHTAGKVVASFPAQPLRNPVDVARVDGDLYVLNANNPQEPKPTDVDQILDLGRR